MKNSFISYKIQDTRYKFLYRMPCLFFILCLVSCTLSLASDDVYKADRSRWLQIARETTPALHYQTVKPVAVVKAVRDSAAFQGWRYEQTGECLSDLRARNFKEVKEVTLDFGKHLVGHFRFHTRTLNRCQDAPIRIRFFFGELPAELNTPLDPWRGTLSRAWMQDEVVTVMQTDTWIDLPRRFAFRYLKITLLGASADFDFAIDDVEIRAQSSAGEMRSSLLDSCPKEVADIHRVGIETLHECMQTVYEDGPKRDRRLWIGDMYLESLANRYSFQCPQMTKHCLYLFAALAAEDGILISNCFETPEPHPQTGSYCLTYCLLWNSTLLEYLKETGDRETALDLWQVAKRQTEDALTYVDGQGVFNQYKRETPVWLFFDWREGLDVNTPMQGATIFARQQTYELARLIGKAHEVSDYPRLIRKMQAAARKHLYDKKRGVMMSGNDRQGYGKHSARPQVSILAQTWCIKSGVLSPKEGRRALRKLLSTDYSTCRGAKCHTPTSNDCLMPGTPYATHYLIEAMLLCGMEQEARSYLIDYWGGMVRKGADTFWEAYDPADDFLSPYGFSPANSACHAWSCTPVYFIHKYPEVFQID